MSGVIALMEAQESLKEVRALLDGYQKTVEGLTTLLLRRSSVPAVEVMAALEPVFALTPELRRAFTEVTAVATILDGKVVPHA